MLYAALGSKSSEEAKACLNSSGLTFAQSTEELAAMSRHLPHLEALGKRDEDWNPFFMAERAQVLLRLVHARLKDWLGLEWSEESTDQIVSPIEEEIESDEAGDYQGNDGDS